MHILGLTGSIGMGKSAVAAMLRREGVPLHDADAAVHRLMAAGGAAVPAIEAAFPGVVVDGAVDRKRLGAEVFPDDCRMRELERILHPLVRREAVDFLKRQCRWRVPLVALDVPLLFETGADYPCDAIAVVSAPRFVQEARVLARPGMTRERLEQVRARQMPDAEKRRRADFVIPTGIHKGQTLRHLQCSLKILCERPARAWPPTTFRPTPPSPVRQRRHA